jgi:uncharacterized protein (DUF1684 family)
MSLTRRNFLLASALAVCLPFALETLAQQNAKHSNWVYKRDIYKWQDGHAAELRKPDGWLALAGLEWLDPGDNSFGSAPDNKVHMPASAPAHLGVLHLESDTVTLNPPANGFPQGFLVDASPAQPQLLHVDPDHDKNDPRMSVGTLNFYVIKRGERFALRIKDTESASRTNFHGLKWYPVNAHYRVKARWIPYTPRKTFTIATLIGTSYPAQIPGSAEFTLDAKTYRLDPILEDPAVENLFFVLRDTTSTTKTYGACRFLYTRFPDHGIDSPGELLLDFNHLENPPCAYTPFATCPLPPRQNRLPIPLPVGELRYHD